MKQDNLMDWVNFSLIGYDPKVSHLLPGIATSNADIADEGKSLRWKGGKVI